MRNRIRKRADASGINALKKANDGSVAKEDPNKGIPLMIRCKKASISNSRKSNGSIKCNTCEDSNQNIETETTNQDLLNTHNVNDKKVESNEIRGNEAISYQVKVDFNYHYFFCFAIIETLLK